VESLDDFLVCTVYDEDYMIDDFVGQRKFTVAELTNNPNQQWYDLYFEGTKSAEILLQARVEGLDKPSPIFGMNSPKFFQSIMSASSKTPKEQFNDQRKS